MRMCGLRPTVECNSRTEQYVGALCCIVLLCQQEEASLSELYRIIAGS